MQPHDKEILNLFFIFYQNRILLHDHLRIANPRIGQPFSEFFERSLAGHQVLVGLTLYVVGFGKLIRRKNDINLIVCYRFI